VPRTGAVESIQRAEVDVPKSRLGDLWKPQNLERLARAYWRWLNRISLGLIRVVYEPDSRTVVLLFRPLALLRFHAPEYETSPTHGVVTWRIERVLLVSREGRGGEGYLRISIERPRDGEAGEPAAPPPPPDRVRLRLEVAVANFYPWLRGSGRFARFGTWIYSQTQLRIHVVVCNGFLRSLAKLELPPPRAGALVGEIDAGGGGTPESVAVADEGAGDGKGEGDV